MAPVDGSQECSESEPGASSPLSEGKYQVERILAQDGDDEIMYLVKWEGYGYEQCTWELAESFDTPTTISTWQEQLTRGETLDGDQVQKILARMDAFRSQQAELARQQRRLSEDTPRESERLNRVQSESASSVPRPGLAPAPPKATTARLSSQDRYHDSDKTVSAPVAPNPSSWSAANKAEASSWSAANKAEASSCSAANKAEASSCSAANKAEASLLRKRRRSSADSDEQFGKSRRISQVQKISSKHNTPPPPVGLIKPSEIERREPGHNLPATSALQQPDSSLFPRDNGKTSDESIETCQSQSDSGSHTTQNNWPPTKHSASESLPIADRLASSRALSPKDLMVQLSVGSRDIGRVTLTGLPAWLCSTKPWVYIAFGGSWPTEAREVAKWAAQYTSSRLVFIEGQDDAREWQEFRKTCGSNAALLLFSNELAFCQLPCFGKLLGKYNASTLVSFRLSWQTCDPQLPKYRPTQIFSHGTVLLLTEATMKQAAAAVKILQWFKHHSKGKPKQWMVMVRPNIRAWLTRQLVDGTDDSSAHYLEMLAIFSELMPTVDVTKTDDVGKFGSLDKILAKTGRLSTNHVIPLGHLPGYDSSAAADEAQVRQRDDILLSYFLGWSATHVEHHRRFLVLDDDKAERGRAADIYDKKVGEAAELDGQAAELNLNGQAVELNGQAAELNGQADNGQ
ncbi:hypothetical protein DV737_g5720, partial [Chaetothyriales sp. CBS 132003]